MSAPLAIEENLLGLAIREVYARCALTGEQAHELILQEELFRREASELRAGASDVAATLRNLGHAVVLAAGCHGAVVSGFGLTEEQVAAIASLRTVKRE
jgi:hypothetical protein